MYICTDSVHAHRLDSAHTHTHKHTTKLRPLSDRVFEFVRILRLEKDYSGYLRLSMKTDIMHYECLRLKISIATGTVRMYSFPEPRV